MCEGGGGSFPGGSFCLLFGRGGGPGEQFSGWGSFQVGGERGEGGQFS